MSAVWLLSTRGRPEACQEVLDACKATGMTSPGVVYVDETVDEYRNLRLPKNWTIHYEPSWGSLQASLQWTLRQHPDATQYGWLADDTFPRTDGWDKQLEAAAGDWCLSYARDLWLSEDPHALACLEYGDDLSSGLCWGGQLVRTVGWWALPGVRQAGIDTTWCQIVGPLDLARYTPAVIVEHKNYRTGKRARDTVDDWTRDGVDYIDHDIATQNSWACSARYAEVLNRVRVAANVKLSTLGRARFRERMRAMYSNQVWSPDMPAARMTIALERIDAELDRLVAELLNPDPDLEPAG